MAGADYLHCAVCGAKALYDADVDYDYPNLGALVALCKDCRKTHTLKPVSDAEQTAHDEQVRAAAWDEGLYAAYQYVGKLEDAAAAGQGVMIPDPVNPYRTTPAEQKESNPK